MHIVFIFEVVQTTLLTYDRYLTFVTMFGDPLGPETIRTSWFSVPILCGVRKWIVKFLVHLVSLTQFQLSRLHFTNLLRPPHLQCLEI